MRYARDGRFCLLHDPERTEERAKVLQAAKEGSRRAWERSRSGYAETVRRLIAED